MPHETEPLASPQPQSSKPQFNKVAIAITVALIVTISIAVAGAIYFVNSERQRDIQAWQIRLGIIADSRTAAINQWVEMNFSHMRELAQNASLQLYISDIASNANPSDTQTISEPSLGLVNTQDTDEPALPLEIDDAVDAQTSATYLRNLLNATAERIGFKAPPPVGEISANVERIGVAGIGLVDITGVPIVSTPDMPPISGRTRKAVAQALDGEPAVIDLYLGASGEPTMGFVLPIYGIQDDQDGAKGIGAVVGIRTIGKDLYSRLIQPGETSTSSETYLVRKSGPSAEYLTPMADGTPALKRSLSMDTPDLIDANALNSPGGFTMGVDYAGSDVLAASRPIANLTWVLIRKISRNEALSATDNRLSVILGVFIGIIIIVTLAVLYVWKKGASMRAMQSLHDAEIALERFTNVSNFMRVVTDNQPNHIVAVDSDTQYTFANMPAAKDAGLEPADMLGKTMASVIGPVKAHIYTELNKDVFRTMEPQSQTIVFGDDEDDTDASLQVVRVHQVPLKGDRDFPTAVLMILSDITELTHEKRRGEKMMRQLTDTLVGVVDRRDPFSAHHSYRVAEVARAIAHEMGLEELELKTVDIAGNLINLGKIFIPEEVLTKTNDLTKEERDLLANAYLTTAEMLEGVEFDGPVIETIRQFGETIDGNGPLGLKADHIIMTARILSVANAFVGMISTRAYRGAMPFQKAADILLEDVGSKYDRKPVSALLNFLDNRGGADRWAHFRELPPE